MTDPLRTSLANRGGLRKAVRALHFVGLAMFLGSALGHIALSLVPGSKDQAPAILFSRQAIESATWVLTVPGLGLLMASGLILLLAGGLSPLRHLWLALHMGLALMIALNAAFILIPTGEELMAAALSLSQGQGSLDAFLALKAREHLFGPANLLMTLLALFAAALKPAFGRGRN